MNAVFPPLTELFPNSDYGFHLTLRRTEPREFFRPYDASGEMLRERAGWLAAEPARYAMVTAEGVPLVAEFAGMAAEWGLIDASATAGGDDCATLLELGRKLEPDLAFLSADESGAFRLRGGAVVFPTGWALEEKVGHTLDFIHGVVPGLNPALGSPIQQFLTKLRPGTAFLRHNWGLATTDECNLHPARRIAPPTTPVQLEKLWLRVEHQALIALPKTRGIAFGIRIASHRLDRVAESSARAGLKRALMTMPSEVAVYKQLEAVRLIVISLL
ncbi:MAG: heme-dependent oxidative N-demethylase subunit alpha family protein [Verrucomicrobiota bacterium]